MQLRIEVGDHPRSFKVVDRHDRIFALLMWMGMGCISNMTFVSGSIAAEPTSVSAASSAPISETVDFTQQVRPLLSNRCFACHGPDEQERAAGLRLDTVEGLTEDLGGYAAVVPGQADKSELLARIESEDPDVRMPPGGDGEALTPSEIELIRGWINQGAVFEGHWAYELPVARPAPPTPMDEQPRSPIDAYVIEKRNQLGWEGSPEADRSALARRVALDLIGLPPSREQVQSFVNDESPRAYERYVDRLLADPAFGERWARVWLDLARYADSAGYADDPKRTIWAYRDYVVDAFNAALPFDQFTMQQLAGDLMPEQSVTPWRELLGEDAHRIATAFHRNTMTNNEGGTNDEEFRNEAVVDRTNTTFAVWMGTTMACAQCHTHKFDPITQDEYFQIFAFFNNTADKDKKDESPIFELYRKEQKIRRKHLEGEIQAAGQSLNADREDVNEDRKRWFDLVASEPPWKRMRPIRVDADERKAVIEDDGTVRVEGKKPAQSNYAVAFDLATWKRDEGASPQLIRLVIPPKQSSNFVLTGMEIFASGDSGDGGGGDSSRSQAMTIQSIVSDAAQQGFAAAGILAKQNPRQQGWAIGGMTGKRHDLTLLLDQPIPDWATELEIRLKHEHPKHQRYLIDAFQIEALSADWQERAMARARLSMNLRKWVSQPERNDSQEKQCLEFHRGITPVLQKERKHLERLKKQLADIRPLTTVPVMQELPSNQQRTTKVQIRGNYQNTSNEVKAGTPAALHPLRRTSGLAPNRLDLAKWLVDPANPLTARVIANRHWEKLFGIGIVSTSEEFGSQGELPTHPELLDHLAIQLQTDGWDLKKLLREIVTSATYRQSSRVDPDTVQRDPDNRYFARGPRHRITAEMVRDQALAVSDLLCHDMHGPPVHPPQPNLGLKAAFGSETDWKTSKGGNRYRRGLYTMWRRSSPYPSMAAFDAPTREVCLVRRDRTNTPLQALVTLNDPVYVEAAQALARAVIREATDLDERISLAYQRVLIREPSASERQRIRELLDQLRARYEHDPELARTMAEDPIGPLSLHPSQDKNEAWVLHAMWTVVGNVLLNLDETFMKR